MSDLLTPIDGRDLYANPPRMKPAIQEAKRIIDLAARMRRWPEMETAIEVLIDRQQTLVDWWKDHVREKGGAHFADDLTIGPGAGLLAVADAERLLAMRHQAVSRLRLALLHIDAYRDRLIQHAKQQAGIEAANDDPAALRPQPARDGPDFWPTPASLVNVFISTVLPLLPAGMIWECAAGDGRLVSALLDVGRDVYASDLYPQDESAPCDFLTRPPPCEGAVVATNPPYNASDGFIERGLTLLDARQITGLALLLRHDHLQAGSRVDAFNRATIEVHCNWRPIWIAGTEGQPRWSFHWICWTGGRRRAPIYLSGGGGDE